MYTYIYIRIRRPLLVRGHQAAKHMKLITVKVFFLSVIVSLLVLVSKHSLLSAIVSLLVLVSAVNE